MMRLCIASMAASAMAILATAATPTATFHKDVQPILQNHCQECHRAGEMARIREPVKARLELCEIADRVMKQPGGGKALYFENVILDNGERSQYPVVINLFGSMRRMSLALGVAKLLEGSPAHFTAQP